MLLGIKTDNPVAELYLYSNEGKLVASKEWQADRELAHWLLREIDVFLGEHDSSLQTLTGLFVFQGPGSFTGLRIGITVMNTLSYAESIPIVGAQSDDWRQVAVSALLSGANDRVVLPFYGAEARVTMPRK